MTEARKVYFLPSTSERAVIRAELMEIQRGLCAICGSDGRLIVDHDHETGLVRGLLCTGCNNREGQAASDLFCTVADDAMTAYLANPPAAGRDWIWDLPDRIQMTTEEAMAVLATIELPPLPAVSSRRGLRAPETAGRYRSSSSSR